ncbi:hypothetical protein OESDEN_04389 [Oesophagostomum dentatum]|uniref:Amiloride-sensitive sodium channel n=1 Tax=Oesophagostomum dentatum TaxID=61180 RepID=A0A0B1TJW0_OESDE|nr:hypothetical protein OESDEN_04389 [Oesophagostomum dentatum]
MQKKTVKFEQYGSLKAFRDFQEFYDPTYGICQMFNLAGNYSSSRAGPLYGLRMVIRTDQAKYLPWTETAGVVISIHGKDERPFPDVFGYFASPGVATSMGVRFVSTLRLPKPYGTCTTQEMFVGEHYKGTYEARENQLPVESCFRNCLQNKIISDCGCYDPAYPYIGDGAASSCDAANDTLAKLWGCTE